MSDVALAVIALVLLGVSAVLFVRHSARTRGFDERWLPPELRGAAIAYAERTFRSHRRGLVARLDRAYRRDGGELTLVELKTRDRSAVYMRDIIELSVQRLAVQDEVRERVSLDAYVLVQRRKTGKRAPMKVRLLGEPEVMAMRDRYRELVAGAVRNARPATAPAMCQNCGHLSTCSRTYGDRVGVVVPARQPI